MIPHRDHFSFGESFPGYFSHCRFRLLKYTANSLLLHSTVSCALHNISFYNSELNILPDFKDCISGQLLLILCAGHWSLQIISH